MPLHGEEKRAYQRRWMKARRDAWLVENGPCVQCGSDVDLEVDHKDPFSKRLNPAELWSLAPGNPKRIDELAKCQVLCGSCHQAKTDTDMGLKLGGVQASNATLTPEMLEEVRRRLAAGEMGKTIALDLGVTKWVVSRVKRGKAYKQ